MTELEFELYKQKVKYKVELENINKWLKKNDYIINKVFLGEWEENDPRFIAYKQERAIKRARLDELEEQLKQL